MQFNFRWTLTNSFIPVHRVHSASYHIWRWLTSTIKILECNPVGTAVAVLNQCTSPFPLCFLRIAATFPELIAEIFNGDRRCLAASARPLQHAADQEEERRGEESGMFPAFNKPGTPFHTTTEDAKKVTLFFCMFVVTACIVCVCVCACLFVSVIPLSG